MAVSDSERTYAMWMHVAGLSSYIGIPLGHILVPLILWSIKRSDSPYIDRQGREVLNFQLSVTFYLIFSYILIFLLIGFLFLALVIGFHVIAIILAAVRTINGQEFRYPITFRVIRPAA
jgi:uncharacterized Tic20 family protein